MNQILVNKKINNKKKYFFKMQLILSVIIALVLTVLILINRNKNEDMENISETIDKNIKLIDIYTTEEKDNELYLGKIFIDKIDMEYIIFNDYNEELLKIAPCKFYGEQIDDKGNICIAAHNYNDNRFFSRIAELDIKDEIKLIDLEGKEYKYIVYNNFEIDETDFSILKTNKPYELTLLTCNNANKRRIIIKAYMKEY